MGEPRVIIGGVRNRSRRQEEQHESDTVGRRLDLPLLPLQVGGGCEPGNIGHLWKLEKDMDCPQEPLEGRIPATASIFIQ